MHALDRLAAVQWQISAKSATGLAKLGVAHGFHGAGDPSPRAHAVKQVHGTLVVPASLPSTGPDAPSRIEADGLFTCERGVTVAVRTADCLPVLLVAPGRLAMAVHAGWRGLTAGILTEAVRIAADQGVVASDLYAAIGPAIGREQFEVGSEVVRALYGPACGLAEAEASLCAAKGNGDRWHVDLLLAAVLTLLNAGLAPARITAIQACTRSLPTWHSYRRAGPGVPSNWSWITL